MCSRKRAEHKTPLRLLFGIRLFETPFGWSYDPPAGLALWQGNAQDGTYMFCLLLIRILAH